MPTEQTFKVSSGTSSNMTNYVADVVVNSEQLEGSTNDETRWQNTDFSKYYGFFKNIPEVSAVFNQLATWICGKEWTSPNARDRVIAKHIMGYGCETFQQILQNMVIMKHVNGDAYAEIMRDEKSGMITNIKVLDPGSMVIVADKKGIIKRYEQVKGKETIKFEPQEIFHLANKRVGDNIGGTSDLECLQKIIEANNESFVINKDVIKKFSRPMMKFMYDTDDTALINASVIKMDNAVAKGENIHIPKGTVEHEIIAIPPNATLNILPWRQHLKDYFYQVCGIPQILMGSASDFTESSAKIAYLSFFQRISQEQLEIENAIWYKLQLEVKLTKPASLQNEMLSDEQKDSGDMAVAQPADLNPGAA